MDRRSDNIKRLGQSISNKSELIGLGLIDEQDDLDSRFDNISVFLPPDESPDSYYPMHLRSFSPASSVTHSYITKIKDFNPENYDFEYFDH